MQKRYIQLQNLLSFKILLDAARSHLLLYLSKKLAYYDGLQVIEQKNAAIIISENS